MMNDPEYSQKKKAQDISEEYMDLAGKEIMKILLAGILGEIQTEH